MVGEAGREGGRSKVGRVGKSKRPRASERASELQESVGWQEEKHSLGSPFFIALTNPLSLKWKSFHWIEGMKPLYSASIDSQGKKMLLLL